jgi:acetate kinase
MNILVINCGSSSLKYQLIDTDTEKVLAKGLCERIGLEDAILNHTPSGKDKVVIHCDMPDHNVAIKEVVNILTDAENGVIASLEEISAVGHRVVHGGEKFNSSVPINDDVMAALEECIPLAPLHNPPNIIGIKACQAAMPGVPQVGVFDTAFHQTMPKESYMYAIPYEYYEKYRVRKYGFHGTSHKFVARVGAEMFGLDFENSKIVTCHIGNGASVTAVKNGKSFDTSMGFTPLDGLVMGTRAGSMDVSAATYIAEKEGLSYKELDAMLNKQSGVQGLTGISSDMRDIDAAYDEGNERAIMARDMYANRIKKFIGEYAAEMGGVDLVIFTGGVGENSPEVREYALQGLEFMGLEFDAVRNRGKRGTDYEISAEGSRVKAAVICTDEELVIAKDTFRLTK